MTAPSSSSAISGSMPANEPVMSLARATRIGPTNAAKPQAVRISA
jgi:hypothetical protein